MLILMSYNGSNSSPVVCSESVEELKKVFDCPIHWTDHTSKGYVYHVGKTSNGDRSFTITEIKVI